MRSEVAGWTSEVFSWFLDIFLRKGAKSATPHG